MIRWFGLGLVIGCLIVSIITGWPWAHTFDTYRWPGPFGWIATNTPGNVVAGFLQVGLGFLLGYGAHRVGVFDRAKAWLTAEIHEHHEAHHQDIADIRRHLEHLIEHSPKVPPLPPKE